MNKILISLTALGLINVASCQEKKLVPENASWKDTEKTWNSAAEIARYDLKQEFYGKIVTGEAMMIYVKEPFLEKKQVKDESGKGNYQVLKLNATREFKTGFYPYHTLTSVFQPIEPSSTGKALKVTTSVQDWCGHVFMQTNRKDGNLVTEVRSYFEKEDNGVFKEKSSALLEDEVWTALRLNPTKLPTGEVSMIPGSLSQRFSHTKPIAMTAQTKWAKGNTDETITYEIYYPSNSRKLTIEIQSELPYEIQGWHESNNKGLLSSGTLKKRLTNVDYWNYTDKKSGNELRKKMGLN